MIKQLLIFAQNGTNHYSWKASDEINDHDVQLISGFLTAVKEFSEEVFADKLQSLELENERLIITAKTIQDKLYIIGTLIGNHDSRGLIDKILDQVLEIVITDNKLRINGLEKNQVDERVTRLIHQYVYDRSPAKLFVSGALSFIVILLTAFPVSVNYLLWFENNTADVITITSGIIIGSTLLVLTASIAGSVRNSIFVTFFGCLLGSIVAIELVHNYLSSKTILIYGVGTPIVFVMFALLVGILSGYLGGYLSEQRYLFTN